MSYMKHQTLCLLTIQILLLLACVSTAKKQLHLHIQNPENIAPEDIAGVYKNSHGKFQFYSQAEAASVQPCVSITFTPAEQTQGWREQHTKLFGNCNPGEEFWLAGYLEGFKHWELMTDMLSNEQLALSDSVSDWNFYWKSINKIIHTVRKEIANDKGEDPFLKWVGLIQDQLDGILDGYNAARNKSIPALMMAQLYFLNFGGSVGEMYEVFTFQKNTPAPNMRSVFLQKRTSVFKNMKRGVAKFEDANRLKHGHCNAFAKFIKDVDGNIVDFLFAHTTYDYFQNTIKTMKTIEIKIGDESYSSVFPSYPGIIYSGDDYYLTGHGLVITETTLSALSPFAYQHADGVKSKYPDFMRVWGATLMAKTPYQWIDIMKRTNTGTYSSQWMIIDLNAFKASLGSPVLKKKTFWVAEQSTQRLLFKDFSVEMSDGTMDFWASFNTPYFAQTQSDLQARTPNGAKDSLNPVPTYTNIPKYQIFEQYNPTTNNIEDLKRLMRLNRYGVDPSIDPCGEIAARCDLSKNDPDYFGAVDVKAVNYDLANKNTFDAEFGPTHDNIVPFTWPQDYYSKLKNLPTTYVFDWLTFGY